MKFLDACEVLQFTQEYLHRLIRREQIIGELVMSPVVYVDGYKYTDPSVIACIEDELNDMCTTTYKGLKNNDDDEKLDLLAKFLHLHTFSSEIDYSQSTVDEESILSYLQFNITKKNLKTHCPVKEGEKTESDFLLEKFKRYTKLNLL